MFHTGWSVQHLAYLKQDGLLKEAEMRDLKAGIREILHVANDSVLDEEDPNLLMRAWEVRNEKFIRWLVLDIVTACPSIEEFDWWIKSRDEGQQYVLWQWKVRRHGDGRLKSLVGKLTWSGCFEGCMPMKVAVGSELEYAIKAWKLAQVDTK